MIEWRRVLSLLVRAHSVDWPTGVAEGMFTGLWAASGLRLGRGESRTRLPHQPASDDFDRPIVEAEPDESTGLAG